MRWAATAVVLTVALIQPGQAQNKGDGITLVPVKYDGLKDAIHKQRGKVVLVDFWGEF